VEKSALKVVKYEKIKEINQGPDENLSAFYHLTEAMIKYTHLTPESNESHISSAFILSPSWPLTSAKNSKDGP
jgi:hypothetical protein